jgi:hypothetical protein
VADGINVVIIPPTSSATGNVVNLGTFTGTGTINWTNAAGMIAYIDVSVEAASNVIPPSLYTVNATYDEGAFNTEMFLNPPNPTATIFAPPDITNATQARLSDGGYRSDAQLRRSGTNSDCTLWAQRPGRDSTGECARFAVPRWHL